MASVYIDDPAKEYNRGNPMRRNSKATHYWSAHCLGLTMKNTLPQQLRILVAEDSAIYGRLIGDLLTEWGFDLVIARDGAEA
jgi:hypothetical protein